MADSYRFDAQSVRRIADTVLWKESFPRDMTGSPPPQGSSGTPVQWHRGKSASGEEIPAFSVVKVGGVYSSFDDGYLYNTIDKPTTTLSRLYGLTGQNPIPANGSGGFTFESGWATFDSSDGTPANGETWGPKPGSWKLAKGYPGFTVLGVVGELAVVVPSGLQMLVGKTTDDITAGSTTDWAIHKGPVGSGAATTYTAPSAVTLIDLVDDIWIKASWDGNGWFLEPLQCEPS